MRVNKRLELVGLLAVVLWGSGWSVGSCAEAPTLLIRKSATWKYSAGQLPPPADWKQASFDDAAWKSGAAGFGYGDLDDATVLDDMQGRYTAVYIRAPFDLERLDGVGSLYLYVNFDDGFIAYLNGEQVVAASVKRDGNAIQVEQHEAVGYEEFVIRDAPRLLKSGRNVLAIEGHNSTLDSSDFSLAPLLSTQKLEDPAAALDVADYLADIDELEQRLLDQSSYLTRLGFDYKTALTNLRHSIDAKTQLAGFVFDVQKLVMQIGDCHAGVRSSVTLPTGPFLPLRLADTSDGVAALGINLDRPLDAECPHVESIDGLPLQHWLDAAAKYVASGSPQLVRRRSLEELGQVALLRQDLKLPMSETVTIGLRSADGVKHTTQKLRLTKQGYAVAQVRSKSPRLLAENIGYLSIPAMDDRLIEPTVAKIKSFRDAKGLIIDVRNNSGGTYGVLRGIYGFFVPDDAKPHITNIAAYRLSANFASDHIEYRPTYRADWDGWNDEERAAIHAAAAAFKPDWRPPESKFSDWHYMILSRERSGRGSLVQSILGGSLGKDYFFFDKPVVVLCNAGSFSAADGFLNAFADLPQVTLVGEPSAGGSGATRQFQLSKTRVLVALSSMASFRPNGKLFDGNGIEVDVAVKPRIEDYTTDGDSVLERAVAVIKEKSKQ